MGYDKHQVAQEFTSWSESYDRSILQWLLFGPSHRVLIKRIREAAGDRPIKMLDVGCGTGVFASKVRACLAAGRGLRRRPGLRHAGQGTAAVATASRTRFAGTGRQRTSAVRLGIIRHRDLRQQLPPLPASGSRRRGDAARACGPAGD